MTAKLLTIAIPTFNRANHLALLLETLATEIRGLEDAIEVVVCDNASPDHTQEITAAFALTCAVATIIRHDHNIGSAPNFVACYQASTSRYFWMFGDDDAPAKGLLGRVVELLKNDEPDLVYVDSKWLADIRPLLADPNVPELRIRRVNRKTLCRRVNVYLTFISSIIVDKWRLAPHIAPEQLVGDMGAYFVQLSWSLLAIRYGTRFVVIEGPCVLATGGNSGGYGLMTVFGAELPKALDAVLGPSAEVDIVMSRTVACYLPALCWAAREGTKGNFFAEESLWDELRQHLGRYLSYWLFVVPIGSFPRPIARVVYFLARAVSYGVRRWDRQVLC